MNKWASLSHARSLKQEKEWAKKTGAKRIRGSGSGNEKLDVRLRGVFRMEVKTTMANSFSVTRDLVRKVEEAAMASSELPIIVVEFNDNGRKTSDVAILPTWALEELLCLIEKE